MRMSSEVARVGLLVGSALMLMASNCTTGNNGSEDAGPQEIVCTSKSDCPDEFYECTQGVCRKPCGNDDVCDFGEFCTNAGFCQRGCRDTASCNDPEKLCVAGVCTDRSGVGACATKADCVTPPDTNVCVDGACVPPPANCTGPQDCPGAGQCNGFTRQCFNPNGDCMVSADCNRLTMCAGGGCTCTPDRQCVTTPTCTLMNEGTACGSGQYCDVAQTPSRCAQAPACVKQADCDAVDLACNRTTRICERTPVCTSSTQCSGRYSFCNVAAGFCQEPTCTNGGTMCQNGAMCAADGTCGGGPMCTTNSECSLGPPVQYCNATSRTCQVGCRSDADCNAQLFEKCTGAHICEVMGMGTGGGDGEACPNGDGDCRAGYLCSPLLGVCREACMDGACPPCPQTGYGCFLLYCSPTAMPPMCTP